MRLFFTGLAFWCVVVLLTAAATGIGSTRFASVARQTHILAGLFAAIFTCLVHSIVFAHLLGSGRSIKDAVANNGLDPSLERRTRKFKARAFPFALFAALAAVAAALIGGAAYRGSVETLSHGVVAAGALLMSLLAFPFEIRVMADNTRLIKEIRSEIERRAT